MNGNLIFVFPVCASQFSRSR